jgi:hypothetical protein
MVSSGSRSRVQGGAPRRGSRSSAGRKKVEQRREMGAELEEEAAVRTPVNSKPAMDELGQRGQGHGAERSARQGEGKGSKGARQGAPRERDGRGVQGKKKPGCWR